MGFAQGGQAQDNRAFMPLGFGVGVASTLRAIAFRLPQSPAETCFRLSLP